jgi:outer membrane lipoprotein-sorting protein
MSWGGLLVAVLTAACTGVATPAAAPPAVAPPANARELLDAAQKLNQTSRAWTDRIQRMNVAIVDRRGSERQREMEVRTKKYGPRASRSILFFLTPAEVRGVGLLQWIEPGAADRNWLYLPEMKRVRQISGSDRQGSFVGTDFSYEDLAILGEVLDWTDADAAAAVLRMEDVDGHACAVIELVPKTVDVTYAKVRLWLDRDELVARKLELEDKKGRLAKTLLLSDIRPVGHIPAAHALEMRDERGGSRTRVVLTDIRYDTGIAEDEFTERRLERGV